MTDIMSDMLKNCKFKELEYSFLVNIAADDEELVSLNSSNLKMKIYRKSNGKMVELLSVTGELSGDDSNIDIIAQDEKGHKVLFHMKAK